MTTAVTMAVMKETVSTGWDSVSERTEPGSSVSSTARQTKVAITTRKAAATRYWPRPTVCVRCRHRAVRPTISCPLTYSEASTVRTPCDSMNHRKSNATTGTGSQISSLGARRSWKR